MPSEHVLIAEQTVDWDTHVNPTIGVEVQEWSSDTGIEYLDLRNTGGGRGLSKTCPGPKLVNGSFTSPLWQNIQAIGLFAKMALMHDIQSTLVPTATTAYRHGFIPKDDDVPYGLTGQGQHSPTTARNWLGILFDELTFAVAAGEIATIAGNFVAKDEVKAGEDWTDTTTASPAIQTPVYPTVNCPFKFNSIEVIWNPTLTWVPAENVYTMTGGTNITLIDSLSITMANNLDLKNFIGDTVARNAIGQDREITGTFDFDQSTPDFQFYDLFQAGTEQAVWFRFTGEDVESGFPAEVSIVMPYVVVRDGNMYGLEGSQSRRVQPVSFTALKRPNEPDINIQIVDTQTSY